MNYTSKFEKLKTEYGVKTSFVQKQEVNDRIVQAIGNTYNYFDSDADVLRVGSSKKSIKERGVYSTAPNKIMHLAHHDLTKPIGKFTTLEETKVDGYDVLYFESKLSETEEGEEVLVQYREGILNQHSIGFKYIKLDYIDEKSPQWEDFLASIINPDDAKEVGFAWDVHEIKLYEISTVSFGANALTPMLGLKTAEKWMLLDNIYSKLNTLLSLAKSGKHKSVETFDLQVSQLKQQIKELYADLSQSKCDIVSLQNRTEADGSKDLLMKLI